jgi:predicted ester cyclase
MSAKDLRALTRRWFEEYNKGKAAATVVADEFCATDFVLHGAGIDIPLLKDFKQKESEWYDAFPDMHVTIDDMVAEGDKVAMRITMTGTHKGEYMGIPPTNRKVTLWAIEIDRVVGCKFVEGWTRYDTLGLMQQLGAIPTRQKK